MNILIAGASGFVGKLLVKHLAQLNHLTVVGRKLEKLNAVFPQNIQKITWDKLDTLDAKNFDIVFNLAGLNIGEKRWNNVVKQEIIHSRVNTNHQLTTWLMQGKAKPRFFCASAVGIYGASDHSTTVHDESFTLPAVPHDFMQDIGMHWESSLEPARNAGIPVTSLRFGVVLKKGEGMLKKLEPSFRWGLGSILGSGKQGLSWVYYQDLLRAIDFVMTDNSLTGAINVTSPTPVSQEEFAKTFADTLRKPLFIRMPSFMVKLLFGEMGEWLLLKGQRASPKRLQDMGFCFAYPTLEAALRKEF